MKKTMKKQKGFTLVELLIVTAIIAVLATIVTPAALGAIEKSKATAALADIRAYQTATLTYYVSEGKYPTQIQLKDEMSKLGVKDENPWGGTYAFTNGTDTNTLTVSGVSEKGLEKLVTLLGESEDTTKYVKTFDNFVVEVVPEGAPVPAPTT
ncbi:type IV pilin protein [Youngiibacter multivorans]|uniref:Prepilin-type N-terminal cleavage/methylation domain-containing protein n=1 Tax=Youngiibacter multivorans TaxID=937251 RepID=A0ABS4G7Q6_9CLOT|nr:type II secretion system protein [Youngiibacter multivorans]MBP1920573.1 prepilin-type N-terminal cleavage/methylation domain-containing protein [Youngiibacter multivorans]